MIFLSFLNLRNFIFHTFGPNDLLHSSPALHFKTFRLFQIYFSKRQTLSATQSYDPNVATNWLLVKT